MAKKNHTFLITLRMDDKTIATRAVDIDEYNEDIIYSLRLNQLMTEMSELVTDALRENDIEKIFMRSERPRNFGNIRKPKRGIYPGA